MEKLTLNEICKCLNGEVLVRGNNENYIRVCTDTRKLEKGDIFIALKGENFNANNFIEDASCKGACLCIVSEENFNKNNIKPWTTIMLVKDTYKALLDLAKYYRSKLKVKIIGVTGSTGKTSTKDMIAAALNFRYKVFKTKGNFNNEIGLPLMILSLDNSFDVAVLEMGMSNFFEIHRLSDVARPDIGVITNIGISHIENLKTQDNILKAKMEITDFFNENNTLIINNDDKFLSKVQSNKYNLIKIGFNCNNEYSAENIILNEKGIKYELIDNLSKIKEEITLNVLGKHNVYNSLVAIACARNLSVGYEDIKKGLQNIEVTSMRLDFINLNKFTIINDCYNASPDSVKAAIDVMINTKAKRRIAILGTMRELGDMSYSAHQDVGNYAKEKNIDYLFTLGEFNKAFLDGFGCKNFKAFETKNDLIDYMNNFIKDGDLILVKASRYMKFEDIVEKLKTINC